MPSASSNIITHTTGSFEDTSEAIIQVKGLSKSFGDVSVLENINLNLFKGENFVVLGRSGSGKSVLIKILAGLISADEGSVLFFGHDITRFDKKQWQKLRLRLGFLFQGNALYDSMTVRENLEFPLIRNKRNLSKKEIDYAVQEVLDQVDLKQTIDQLPAELSGGQKKRIGIARTLILKPEIIFYDEPTSGLDPITCMDINNLILQVQKNYQTASVIITHDLTCAKSTGNRIALLIDGKFSCEGSFENVFHQQNAEAKGFYDYKFVS